MYNACYGGKAALLTCTNWMQSWGWDGRWAVAIATEAFELARTKKPVALPLQVRPAA